MNPKYNFIDNIKYGFALSCGIVIGTGIGYYLSKYYDENPELNFDEKRDERKVRFEDEIYDIRNIGSNLDDIINDDIVYDYGKDDHVQSNTMEIVSNLRNHGYVFLKDLLGDHNNELNLFVETLRTIDLDLLNGCDDPVNCDCTFRHKFCRMLMIRKYSHKRAFEYYSPSCDSLSNLRDLHDNYEIYNTCQNLIEDFEKNFSTTTQDIINFINHLIDPESKYQYVADVQFIADPYYKINENELDTDLDISDIDNCGRECHLNWFKNHFVSGKKNTLHAYDYVALFVLNANEITDHKLMIGKLDSNDDSKNIDELQDKIEHLNDITIKCGKSDIGYIINQKLPIFHKHSDFTFLNNESRRNVLTIRIKHIHKN